jgi:uncharacterized protein
MSLKKREFQVFAKPVGAVCNLDCLYCYYLDKGSPAGSRAGYSLKMNDVVLETYIIQHIRASTEPVINFSWHGGEPTMAGIDFFRRIIEIQKKHMPPGRKMVNGLQTNGTLLDEEWCNFLSAEKFIIGLSIDGPEELHDIYRKDKNHKSAFRNVMKGFRLLMAHGIVPEILCVVSPGNAGKPLEVYRFFRELGVHYITFLPLVIRDPANGAAKDSVCAESFGDFMTAVFDEWVTNDIGKIKIQLFEEAARTAFGQDHTLCIFKKTCGGVPVVETNGDFYSCDHYVNPGHLLGNILVTSLEELLDSRAQKVFGMNKLNTLPRYCLMCEVRSMCNGECPKNRFLTSPDGEPGLNYLCTGYRKIFNHCRPFVDAIGAAWRIRNNPQSSPPLRKTLATEKVNRNDPCPCGSGKKYKRCCL